MCLQTPPLCVFGCDRRKITLEPVSKKVQCASRTVNTILFTHFLQSALDPFLFNFGDLSDHFRHHFWHETAVWIASGKRRKPPSKKVWNSIKNGLPRVPQEVPPKCPIFAGDPPWSINLGKGCPRPVLGLLRNLFFVNF